MRFAGLPTGRAFARPRGLTSEAVQRREQRETVQREGADNEAERESPESAAARSIGGSKPRRGGNQRMFALDHPARHIVDDGIDQCSDIMGFRDHYPAETGVLDKTINALVAAHQNVSDNVDP